MNKILALFKSTVCFMWTINVSLDMSNISARTHSETHKLYFIASATYFLINHETIFPVTPGSAPGLGSHDVGDPVTRVCPAPDHHDITLPSFILLLTASPLSQRVPYRPWSGDWFVDEQKMTQYYIPNIINEQLASSLFYWSGCEI